MQPAHNTTAIEQDDALIADFVAGNPDAARHLAARHLPRVYALALRMLANQAEAEDIAQETMLRLWKHAPDWQPGRAQVGTWLYRVASNLATDRLRSRRNRPADDSALDQLADQAPGVEQRMISAERDTALHQALNRLPDRQKLAITLRHFDELSQPDMAEIMGTSVEAVESLLARGRRALAAMLRPGRGAEKSAPGERARPNRPQFAPKSPL